MRIKSGNISAASRLRDRRHSTPNVTQQVHRKRERERDIERVFGGYITDYNLKLRYGFACVRIIVNSCGGERETVYNIIALKLETLARATNSPWNIVRDYGVTRELLMGVCTHAFGCEFKLDNERQFYTLRIYMYIWAWGYFGESLTNWLFPSKALYSLDFIYLKMATSYWMMS